MSRRVYMLGVGVALVALALAFTDLALSLRPGVTERNVNRIRAGMTLAEVERVLGGPPGPTWGKWEFQLQLPEVTTGTVPAKMLFRTYPEGEAGIPSPRSPAYQPEARRWASGRGTATVIFDSDDDRGRVLSAQFEPAPRAAGLDRVRAWLGW